MPIDLQVLGVYKFVSCHNVQLDRILTLQMSGEANFRNLANNNKQLHFGFSLDFLKTLLFVRLDR